MSPLTSTYLGTGDGHLDLATSSGDELAKLLGDALEQSKAVVLGEGLEEVLDGGVAAAGLLGKLGDDGGLVLGAERWRGQDARQLRVLLEQRAEVGEGLGRGVEA